MAIGGHSSIHRVRGGALVVDDAKCTARTGRGPPARAPARARARGARPLARPPARAARPPARPPARAPATGENESKNDNESDNGEDAEACFGSWRPRGTLPLSRIVKGRGALA